MVSSSPPAIGVSTVAASAAYLPYSSGGNGSSIQNGRMLLHAAHALDRLARAREAEADVDHQVEIVAAGRRAAATSATSRSPIAAERSPAELDRVEAGASLRETVFATSSGVSGISVLA